MIWAKITSATSSTLPAITSPLRVVLQLSQNLQFTSWSKSSLNSVQGLSAPEAATENRKSSSLPSALTRHRLGAGTGLVGIAIAAIWKVDVILTDLPEIQENLLHNITQNLQVIKRMGGTTVGKVLDWKADNDPEFGGERFEASIFTDP